jgi:hypothetical protein
MNVQEIKAEFNKTAFKLGRRDCKVKAVSAHDRFDGPLIILIVVHLTPIFVA